MAERRSLTFHSFAEVRVDVEALAARGYRRLGQWSLGQMCNHLAIFVRGSLDGFTQKVPWFIKPFGGMILRRILKRGMPVGTKVPRQWIPGPSTDERGDVDAFLALLKRYEQYRGALQPSPLFGRLSRETWTELHLLHCAHHLSFLLPDVAAT